MKIDFKKVKINLLHFTLFLLPCFVIAQRTTELPSYYYLYKTKPRTKPYLIKNELIQMRANVDSIKQYSEEIQKQFYEKLSKDEIVELKTGRYHFKNNFEDFTFKINKNGFIDGEAYYLKLKNTSYLSTYTFENGVLIKTITMHTIKNQMSGQSELKDAVLTYEIYYPSGKLKEQQTTDFNIPDDEKDSITTVYFEDGSTNTYSNKIDGTFKEFNTNGILIKHTNEELGFSKWYKEDGKPDMYFYNKGDEYRKEYYRNGLIETKQILNDKESKEYFYENGKLVYYEVYNKKTKERKVYDSKDKLIPGKTIPRVAM